MAAVTKQHNNATNATGAKQANKTNSNGIHLVFFKRMTLCALATLRTVLASFSMQLERTPLEAAT